MQDKKRVLFICLGNICRSPIAEAVFDAATEERNLQDKWECESAALEGYHTGKSPDRRAMAVLVEKGLVKYKHKARPIKIEDFDKFDWIFGMDNANIMDLNSRKPADCRAKVELLGQYDPQNEKIIRDPYYDSDTAGFEKVYEQCVRCINAFLDKYSGD